MGIRIITADERLSAANTKTSVAIFGVPGVGKTSLLKTLPPERTLCLDLEAGLKSVQDWRGASIPIRAYADFRDLVVLIAGPDPSVHPTATYGEAGPSPARPRPTRRQRAGGVSGLPPHPVRGQHASPICRGR